MRHNSRKLSCALRVWTALGGASLIGLSGVPASAQSPAYRVAVVSESGDIATWLRPSGPRLTPERIVPLGVMPSDIDGPHNITVAPDGKSYYVTVAHGTPFGSLWKLDTRNDSILGKSQVELFPTTVSLTPDGQLALVANSDFHGDHPRTNVISVIHTPTMTKITDLEACDMPHGIKVNHAGSRAYVSCMHSDELLELEVATLALTRRAQTGAAHATTSVSTARHSADPPTASKSAECSPTFVSVSRDDKRLYVACNAGNTLQVWDAGTLRRIKEISVGKGAYNVEPSPDGRFVLVTNKKDQSVSVIDAASLTEVARVPTSKRIVHGIAYSPDSRFAYVSCESIGIDPGAVDVVDLESRTRVSTVPITGQPTGITVLATSSVPQRR